MAQSWSWVSQIAVKKKKKKASNVNNFALTSNFQIACIYMHDLLHMRENLMTRPALQKLWIV